MQYTTQRLMSSGPCHGRRRRGSIYVITLGVAMLVGVLGLAAIMVTRVQLLQVNGNHGALEAQRYARVAIDMALFRVKHDANWRQKMSAGEWSTDQAIGNGSYSFTALDPVDDDVADSDFDAVVIIGTGNSGRATFLQSVRLRAKQSLPEFLRTVAHAAGAFTAEGVLTANGGSVSSNTSFVNQADQFTGDAEAPSSSGSSFSGAFLTSPPKPLPLASVFDNIYLPLATTIDYFSLPTKGPVRELTGLLSATSNPLAAATNPNGIYHIQVPASGQLSIKNLELIGTLLISAGVGSIVSDSAGGSWQPHQLNFPVLVVNGTDVQVNLTGSNNQVYQGLIHIIGDNSTTHLGSRFNHTGTIVSEGTITAGHAQGTTLTHDPNLYNNPPLGYEVQSAPRMVPVPGSFSQEVTP